MPEYTLRSTVEAMQFQGDGPSDVELADWLFMKNESVVWIRIDIPSVNDWRQTAQFPPPRLVLKQPGEREKYIPIDHWLVWDPDTNLFVHYQDQEFRDKYAPTEPLEILKEELS